MRKTYTILLTHVVVVGKTWTPSSSSSSLSSLSFSSACCQRRERRGKSWLSADGAPFGWMDGWMGGNGRWRNVWKTEVSPDLLCFAVASAGSGLWITDPVLSLHLDVVVVGASGRLISAPRPG